MNKKYPIMTKILLTFPALFYGIKRALVNILSVIWYVICFLAKIVGITYVLEPVIKLWETPKPTPEEKPKQDRQEDHDFH